LSVPRPTRKSTSTMMTMAENTAKSLMSTLTCSSSNNFHISLFSAQCDITATPPLTPADGAIFCRMNCRPQCRHVIGVYRVVQKKRNPSFNFMITSVNSVPILIIFYCYNKKCMTHKSKIMPATSPLFCNLPT